MKKILPIGICNAVLVSTLIGCGGSGGGAQPTQPNPTTQPEENQSSLDSIFKDDDQTDAANSQDKDNTPADSKEKDDSTYSVPVVEVEILPKDVYLDEDNTAQLVAVGTDENGNKVPMTQDVDWNSMDTKDVDVDQNGQINLKPKDDVLDIDTEIEVKYEDKQQNVSHQDKVKVNWETIKKKAHDYWVSKQKEEETKPLGEQAIYFYQPKSYQESFIYAWQFDFETFKANALTDIWPGNALSPVASEKNWYKVELDADWFADSTKVDVIFSDGINKRFTRPMRISQYELPVYVKHGTILKHSPFTGEDKPEDPIVEVPEDPITPEEPIEPEEPKPEEPKPEEPEAPTIALSLTNAIAKHEDGTVIDLDTAMFEEGDVVIVEAFTSAMNKVFAGWEGSAVPYLVNHTVASTKLVIIETDEDLTLTATFNDAPVEPDMVTLKLSAVEARDEKNNKLNSNSEVEVGTTISVSAIFPGENYDFAGWSGNGASYLANTMATSTTARLPDVNTFSLTATFTEKEPEPVFVTFSVKQANVYVNGSLVNAANGIEAGSSITVTGINPGTDYVFSHWTGTASKYLANKNNASTTMTVPADETQLTLEAIYDYVPPQKDFTQAKADYASQCAACHNNGLGQKPTAWKDSFSLENLTSTIETTMPLSNPSACTGTCASDLAEAALEGEL